MGIRAVLVSARLLLLVSKKIVVSSAGAATLDRTPSPSPVHVHGTADLINMRRSRGVSNYQTR